MTFTEELYEKISNLYVGMTVRGFSELCGKSPSYYGSIKSQNLELSTSAIAHLMEGTRAAKDGSTRINPIHYPVDRCTTLHCK